MKSRDVRVWSPFWLECSGLPELLTEKVKGGAGWILFKKIVELDCEKNSAPGTVEISLEELQKRSGVSPDKVRKAVPGLRKLKMIACFVPDNDEEAALFRVVTPLETPRPAEEIKKNDTHLFEHGGDHFRYYDDCVSNREDELPANDPDLKAVVDLYFDVVGLKMNVFILDELRMLPQRFTMQEIRNVFNQARKNEIRSLHWVIKELVRRRNKSAEVPESKEVAQTPLFAGNDDSSMKF